MHFSSVPKLGPCKGNYLNNYVLQFSSKLFFFLTPTGAKAQYCLHRLHTSHAGTSAFKRLFLLQPVCSHGNYSPRRAWQSCPRRGPRVSDNKHRQLCQRAANTLVRLIPLRLSPHVFQHGLFLFCHGPLAASVPPQTSKHAT